MKAEGRYVALRGGAGAETGRGAPTSPFQHPGGALVEGVTAAAVICEHRPARKHKRACGAERRAVQEAHLRCASPRNSKFHGHLHLKTIEGAGAGGRRVLIRGVLSALEAEHSRRKRGKVEGSPRYGWAAESPSSGPSQGAGGGVTPSRPECSTQTRLRGCATTRGVASGGKGPCTSLHTIRAPGWSRSSSRSSRKRCRSRHSVRRRRNSSGRNQRRQQGQGGQEEVEQEGRGPTPCALS